MEAFRVSVGQFRLLRAVGDRPLILCFLRDSLGGAQVEITHPGEGNPLVPGPQQTVTNLQIADLQTANSRYQTGTVIEGLEGLGTVSWQHTLRSLVAPDKQGPADIYIYIYTYIYIYI